MLERVRFNETADVGFDALMVFRGTHQLERSVQESDAGDGTLTAQSELRFKMAPGHTVSDEALTPRSGRVRPPGPQSD